MLVYNRTTYVIKPRVPSSLTNGLFGALANMPSDLVVMREKVED